MSDARTLIARLIAEGVSPDLVSEVAMALAKAEAASEAIQKRRAADRERQSKRRGHVMSRDVTGQHVTPQTAADVPLKGLPHTPTKTTPQDTPVDASASTAPQGADDGIAAQAAQAGGEGDQPEAEKPQKRASEPRGSRLPEDFAETDEARAICAEMGLRGDEVSEVLAEFCDYWRAVPGAKGRKLDWPATLRNRLREVGRRRPNARASPPAKPRFSNGFFASLDAEVSDPDERYSDPEPYRPRLAAGGRH